MSWSNLPEKLFSNVMVQFNRKTIFVHILAHFKVLSFWTEIYTNLNHTYLDISGHIKTCYPKSYFFLRITLSVCRYVCRYVCNILINKKQDYLDRLYDNNDESQKEVVISHSSFSKWKHSSFFFQNEEIFIQLNELDELDKITPAWLRFNYNLTQAQRSF